MNKIFENRQILRTQVQGNIYEFIKNLHVYEFSWTTKQISCGAIWILFGMKFSYHVGRNSDSSPRSRRFENLAETLDRELDFLERTREPPIVSITKNLPTTSRKPVLLDIGSVLTWHMYHPRSSTRVSFMWSDHVRWPLWVTAIRWFFVMTWVAIVKMVCVSTRSHATCKSDQTDIFHTYTAHGNDV